MVGTARGWRAMATARIRRRLSWIGVCRTSADT
jgi:hypothetical protein